MDELSFFKFEKAELFVELFVDKFDGRELRLIIGKYFLRISYMLPFLSFWPYFEIP